MKHSKLVHTIYNYARLGAYTLDLPVSIRPMTVVPEATLMYKIISAPSLDQVVTIVEVASVCTCCVALSAWAKQV